MQHNKPVAIIGMGCLFPKAASLKDYWRLIFNGIDGISDVPETHWSPADFFDANPEKPDHTYCKRGGFLPKIPFDPMEFGIPPSSLEATDTSQLLGLVAAKMALDDSGYGKGREFNREKTSVILGVTGTQELVIPLGARLGFPKWRAALENSGIPPEKADEVISRISDSYVAWQENSFPGLLGNVVAGRISNRLDLGGTNCVVDAACASSMGAINLAVMELQSGRSDMAVTGGVDTLNDIFMHMCFSKTMTLSSTGDARPFSKHADGTVLGEGIGIMILKRLEDAEKDNDRIYAVIKSIGSSSDGKSQSIYAPRPEGQEKALEMAYELAGVKPSSIELIEAHGTGTKVGDEAEFKALSKVFSLSSGNGHKCALGSIKSMIGHTKAASGAAGIIKAALSLYGKTLPPTLKADEPDPELDFGSTPFYLNSKKRPWLSKDGHPRRSGISAFGFGGSNFHLVLEEYKKKKEVVTWDGSVDILAISASSIQELSGLLDDFKDSLDHDMPLADIMAKTASARDRFSNKAKHRLLITLEIPVEFDDYLPMISDRIETAKKQLRSGMDKDFWSFENFFYGSGESKGGTAFLFPGQGSQYPGMGADIVCTFPDAMDALYSADKAFGKNGGVSDLIYPYNSTNGQAGTDHGKILGKTDIAQPAIGAVSFAMLRALQYFGLKPDVTAGHSFGELTALLAAGRIDMETFFPLSVARGSLMAKAGNNKDGDSGAMLAVQAPLEELDILIKDNADIVLANRNSMNQGVLSGATEAIDKIGKVCREKGYRSIKLDVSAGFHSSRVADAVEPFMGIVNDIDLIPAKIPVFSNTTGGRYPSDSKKAKELLGRHIGSPVDFISNIKNMYAEGIRNFIEIGPQTVLTGLVKSILEGREFNALAMDMSSGKKSGIADLARVLCNLAASGLNMDLTKWEHVSVSNKKQLMNIPLTGANYIESKGNNRANRVKEKKKAALHAAPRKAVIDDAPLDSITKDMPKPSIISGSGDIVKRDIKDNSIKTDSISGAFLVVQEGLKSMQALQLKTAETHEKFLETQAEASRTLQKMMESTGRLVEASAGLSPAPACSDNVSSARNGDSFICADANVKRVADKKPEQENTDAVNAEKSTPPNEARKDFNDKDTGSVVDRDIEENLLNVVTLLTGYPSEMLGLEMDIESDLGIDSIKRVEIFSTLEEKLPDLPAVSPEKMAGLKTLGQIADYLAQDIKPGDSEDIIPVGADPVPHVANSGRSRKNNVKRRVVSVVEQKLEDRKRLSIPSGRKIYITDSKTGLAEIIADEFAKHGIKAVILSKANPPEFSELQSAAGLVLLHDEGMKGVNRSSRQDDGFLKDAFLLSKSFARHLLDSSDKGGALFASVTSMDGAFGFRGKTVFNPLYGGLAGLIKTAAIEWEGVNCRAMDLEPGWTDLKDIAGKIVLELLNCASSSSSVEIGIAPASRVVLELEPSESDSAVEIRSDINSNDVILITGGAKGVTAASALALAEYAQPTLVLLGRSPEPEPEPVWLASIDNEADMKKAILEHEQALAGNEKGILTPSMLEKKYRKYISNREICGNLEKIKRTGARVSYYSVDVRNQDEVKAVYDKVISEYGPATGIIHGAGVLEDRLIIDKTGEQFEKVFDTKVKGFNALLEAVKNNDLKFIVIFSSITARSGNIGQADYAVANEVLNKMAQQESLARPECRTVSINWGPWDGGMVTEALKREFAGKGIALIPVDKGAEKMIRELSLDPDSHAEVVIGADFIPEQDNSDDMEELSLTFKQEVDVQKIPVLQSHMLDGKAVVPFALMAEWFGHGALHANPGLFLHGLDDMRLLNGIKLENDTKMIRLMTGSLHKNGTMFELDVELKDGIKENGKDLVHSRARAILTSGSVHPPVYVKPERNGERDYNRTIDDVYEQVLFHGEKLHGIKKIVSISSSGIVAEVASAPAPSDWMIKPLRSRWIADPLVLDSAFQVATLWCYEEQGVVSLPSYAASYRQYRKSFPSDDVTVILKVNDVTGRKMTGDFTFIDSKEEVIATLTGYESIMDVSLYKSFKPQYASGK
ncbi:MAG: SDR family NAD(P)-dependent oxidoreductase [Dissulfuribacterales bacterium]